MCAGNIAQRAGGRHIAHRIPGGVAQHVIRHADQGVLFAEHLAVLADNRQAVHIGVNHKAYIRLAALEQVAYLGVVGEFSIRRAVEFDDVLHAQGTQDSGDGNAADGIDTINSHSEVLGGNRFLIHQREVQHVLYMVG